MHSVNSLIVSCGRKLAGSMVEGWSVKLQLRSLITVRLAPVMNTRIMHPVFVFIGVNHMCVGSINPVSVRRIDHLK